MGLFSSIFRNPSRIISIEKFCNAFNALEHELILFERDYWQNDLKDINQHRDRIYRMQTIFFKMYDIIYSRINDAEEFFATKVSNGKTLEQIWMKVRTDLDQINYTFDEKLFNEKQPPLEFIRGNKLEE